MAAMERLGGACFASLVTLTCLCVPLDAQTPANAGAKYVLDFSGSQRGGVAAGTFNNFAFRIDKRQEVKKLNLRGGDQRLPDVVATYDYAECTAGQEFILEKPLRDLAPGDPAWIDSLDIEMLPQTQRDHKWTGGVCYGYREPGGKWRWNLARTPFTYDAATQKFRAHILVQRGPIDAMKLVFDYSVPQQFVSSVSVTTRNISSRPDPIPPRPR